jgi:hypothetical protein
LLGAAAVPSLFLGENALQTKTCEFASRVPFLAHTRKRTTDTKTVELFFGDLKSSRLFVNSKKLLEVLACDQTMELIFLLQTEPLEDAFVTSGTVAGLTRKNEIVRSIIAASIDRNEMIGREIDLRAAEDTFLWKFCSRSHSLIVSEIVISPSRSFLNRSVINPRCSEL